MYIRGASVTEEMAILSLELEGEAASIQAAVDYLAEAGVKVEEMEDDPEA